MSKEKTEDRYTVKAYCNNCDKSGTIHPHLEVPVTEANCPYCGCAYLKLIPDAETKSWD